MCSLAEPFIRIYPLEIFTGATREAGLEYTCHPSTWEVGVEGAGAHKQNWGTKVTESILLVGKNVAGMLAGFITA